MLLPTLAPKAIPQPWYIKKKTLQEDLNQLAYEEERYAQETELSLITVPYDDGNTNNNNNSATVEQAATNNNSVSQQHQLYHHEEQQPQQHQLASSPLSPSDVVPMSGADSLGLDATPPVARNDSVIQPLDDDVMMDDDETPVVNYSTRYLELQQQEFDHSPLNLLADDDDEEDDYHGGRSI
ncbi:hypothetical protein BDB00DRAFT_838493 [Zychaea mexicana]|uniref:uncharacterized protein n=1 Tax=Zychaea mexicana TaxID=64656 RepID=UPI0022FECE99|nr:uncharacterized protein BDB00DRAFT_838493 [Zychaea mexicana]KAI9490286.1 hypothetical protein BDB00DRAFT_838493 [Zychaea mexicana]